MSLTFKTIATWTKLAIAALLMCSMFSFSVLAQTNPDKPLTKETLEELVEKLKGALAEVIDDEDTRTSITEKWDARMEELVGKTGKKVIGVFLYRKVTPLLKILVFLLFKEFNVT